MTLGEHIQALRKDAGLSQEELGEKLGVARQSVSKWESDTTIPELDKLIAMSRLFGIPVGALLGIEESEGMDRELTDRELKALEEIARKLSENGTSQSGPKEEPPKKKGRRGAIAAVTLIAAGITLMLMSRINNLENQLGNLQYNVSNIQNTVSREIGSISAQVRDILEEQNSVTAGKNYEVADMDLLENTVTFALTATPREYKEGMTAVFSAVGPDFEAVEVPGTLRAGQTFTAELTCPLTDDITLSVGFVTDEAVVTQQLGVENYLRSNTEIGFYGDLRWSVGRTEDKVFFHSLRAGIDIISPGIYKTAQGGQEVKPMLGSLRLWRNGTLFWSQECEGLAELADGHGYIDLEVPAGELELKAGDKMLLSLHYTDNTGREDEVFLDGFVIGENGEPSGMARPIKLAPYSEEWENHYPWEK